MGLPWEDDEIVQPRMAPKAEGRFWENDEIVGKPKAGDGKPSVLEDVGKAIPVGAVRGTAGLFGGLRSANDALGYGASWLAAQAAEKLGLLPNGKTADQFLAATQKLNLPEDSLSLPSTDRIVKGIETETGPLYHAKTVPGQYAQTIAEFAPGAVFGGGSALQRAAQVAIPAVTSETAGQATKGTGYEPYARLGGALVGAGATGYFQRPNAPESVLAKPMKGVDHQSIDDAGKLMTEAKKIGVDLTWDEALSHVTDGATRQLTNVRRVAENTEGGAGVLNPLMAKRPGQVQTAGEQALGDLTPQMRDPYVTGLNVQKAAEGVLGDTNAYINAAEKPYYDIARTKAVPAPDLMQIAQDPAFQAAYKGVRGDAIRNKDIASLNLTDVPTLIAVRKELARMEDRAMSPGAGLTPDRELARNISPVRQQLDTIITNSAPEYGQALGVGAGLRENLLEPIKAGPVGSLSKTADVLEQGNALLPAKPAFNSQQSIADTVKSLVKKDPGATQNLIHTQLRTAFDEATQSLQTGENKFGGAKFAAVVRGNGQQAKNLEAAVKALPDGDKKWDGLNRFLTTMEATGQAPQAGSMTSFNAAIRDKMANGGLGATGKELAGSGGMAYFKRFGKWMDEANAARNSEQIARILTDPASGRILKQLADLPPNSGKAAVLALRLSYMGRTAMRDRSE